MLGASWGCILGPFVGGAPGAVALAARYGTPSGRIKVPPGIGASPIQIDTSALTRLSAHHLRSAVDCGRSFSGRLDITPQYSQTKASPQRLG